MPPHPRRSADPTIAPLARPALAIAAALLFAAVAELPRLSLWARDYGSELVYPAFVLYSALAVLLLRWGWAARPALAAAAASTSPSEEPHVNLQAA
ncbi:hypothetical protein [Nocardia asteroides]|uniref:hypothetical protein n=1 Tax=Nocardia asteroides TaxID=1824 RepID=UPI003426C84E